MKNLFTPSALYLLLGLFFITGSPLFVKSQIVSAPAGGLWTSGSTWVGGLVPGAADNVVIASSVTVNGNACNNISISSGGILRNSLANSYTLTVNGNLTNNGTVSNNTSYNLLLNVRGNVNNTGVMSNNTLTLSGTGNQQLSSSQPLTIANLSKNLTSGRAIATTALNFTGTNIDLNSDTLEFSGGNAISMNGGYLSSGVLYKSSLPALQITASNGTYASGLTIDAAQTELNGAILIFGTNNFKNIIINNGILQNYPSNSYTLNVNGSLTNNGIIQNNVYNFTVNISGNMVNNGVWTNYSTILNGSGNQGLAMSQSFGGANFSKTASAGRVIATTGLSFLGTTIDFNTDTLEFTTGNTFSIDGGSVNSGILYKSALPALQVTSGNGTYAYILTIDAPQSEFYGDLLIYGNNNIFRNNVINFGTLQNRPVNSYNLTINGNFTNNGIVKNNVYNFTVNVSGNLTHNGTWTNYSTILNGSGNQELVMSQPFGGANFSKTSSAGRVIAATGLSFVGTFIDFNADTLEFSTGSALTMSGGYLDDCVLYKTALPAIQLSCGNGNYLSALTIDAPQIWLYGSVQIYSTNIFKSNVINYGALQNRPVNTYTLSVTGNFTNNGSILNNVYNFNLNISGNVTNTGTWTNRETNLTGTNTHSLSFSNRFEGDFFTNTNAAGSMIATSNLIFDGSTIDLNNCSFSLANGGRLSVLNGSLTDALISGSNIHFHSIEAYCLGVIFNSDVTLQGVFQAGTGVSFNGSIINNGVMRNRGTNSYEIQVQGGLENNGSITNNVYNFTITVFGDIHNSGTWSNYVTILDGASDQYIYLINNKPIQGEIRLDANFSGSGFNWYGPSGLLAGNPAFSGATSQILRFLNPVNSGTYGQYYCRNNQSVDSRSIFINPQILPAINLTVLLEGFYIGNGLMRNSLDVNGNPEFSTSISDQITVELHEAANYSNVVYSDTEVYLNINGTAYVIMPTLGSGSYYMAIKHRNSIETVSSVPFIISGSEVVYHFDAPSDVYGNNLIPLGDGSYAVYGGDVNQDGIVDIADMTPVDNGSASFQRGYLSSDANGDGVIDTGDMTIVDNNSTQFVSSVTP